MLFKLLIWSSSLLAQIPGPTPRSHVVDDFNLCEETGATEFLDSNEGSLSLNLTAVQMLKRQRHDCKLSLNHLNYHGKNILVYERELAESCYRQEMDRINSDIAWKDVSKSIGDLKDCAQAANKPSDDIAAIEASFLKQSAANKEKRRGACRGAAVDETSLGPVRDQGNIGWCYANSAADLMSFYFKKRISSSDLAMNYADGMLERLQKKYGYMDEFKPEGGYVASSIDDGAEKGFCLDANFHDTKENESRLTASIEFLKQIDRFKRARTFAAKPSEEDCDKAYIAASKLMPSLTPEIFTELFKNAPPDKFFRYLRNQACGQRLKPGPSFSATTYVLNQHAMKQMDDALNAGKPVALSYNILAFGPVMKTPGYHASTIVGRRFDERTGECQYHIRNSWDSTWGDKGYMWVGEKAVRDNLLSVTVVR